VPSATALKIPALGFDEIGLWGRESKRADTSNVKCPVIVCRLDVNSFHTRQLFSRPSALFTPWAQYRVISIKLSVISIVVLEIRIGEARCQFVVA
jgi:hypothetical protein